jgi:hypothetical protein
MKEWVHAHFRKILPQWFTRALLELVIVTAFSALPIYFFPAIYTLAFGSQTFLGNVWEAISQGDLYINSSAMIGPIIVAIMDKYGSWDRHDVSPTATHIGSITIRFPFATAILLYTFAVAIISVLCFGIIRFEALKAISGEIKRESIIAFSIYIYASAIIFTLFVLAVRNRLPVATEEGTPSAREFSKGWQGRHHDL